MTKGLEEWKRLYRRARGMSRKELADRLRQQAMARADFLRYKAGFSFEPSFKARVIRGSSPPSAPNFFFSAAQVPRLAAMMRDLFPKETDQTVERAQRICEHRFDLLGYKKLDYGAEIDWHADRVHGKRTPRKPWFQIQYLDFAEAGDSKVTWELNRHQHLVTLAKAYRITNEGKFAVEIFRQWRHWHQENPYPIGINWASSLEVAFRSLSWLWVYYLLAGSAAMPAGFRSDLVRKLAVSGRHIETYLSTYFSANTHLIGEGAALFFIGTLCPELRLAGEWQRRGWTIVQQEAQRQVRADGLHFEQSIYYHVYALDFFLHCSVLASLNGVAIPAEFEHTLERMLNALCVLGRSGPIPQLGDDDGGRLFDDQRDRQEHLLDPLATGAVLFSRGDFKAVAGRLREETLWLLGEAGKVEFERLPAVAPASKSTEFESSGSYVMVDADGKRQLVIDAGPQGADTAGHGHADALSITANVNRHAVLIDSGTFEYLGEGSERNRFRGTKAHNTMVVDGQDQVEPKGPFSWMSLPNVRAEEWIKGESFDFFVGSHDGYMRLPEPILHRRFVFSRRARFWLIRDQAMGRGKHQLELFWHIAPELSPTERDKGTFRSPEASLSILAPESHGWSQELLREDWSPAYGQREPHSVLRFSIVANLPAEFATLLLPGEETNVSSFVGPRSRSAVVCYGFKIGQEQHSMVFGRAQPWDISPWSSDAEFLYWSQNPDKSERTLICCNGSYVETGGKRVISSPRTFSRCEIFGIKGEIRVVSSDEDVVVDQDVFETSQEGTGVRTVR